MNSFAKLKEQDTIGARGHFLRTREFQPVEIIPISTTLVRNGKEREGREGARAATFLHTCARSRFAGKLEGIAEFTLFNMLCTRRRRSS